MDNTDQTKRIILFQKLHNKASGETIIRAKPKPRDKRKIILAKGKGAKTIGKILLARLQPLRFAMLVGLKRKGLNTSGLDFQTLTVLYYNAFSKNKTVDISAFINNPVFRLKTTDSTLSDIDEARNQTSIVAINDVVLEVINIFKRAFERYNTLKNVGLDPNQLMAVEEITQAKAAIYLKSKLLTEAKEDHFLKAGVFRKTLLWIAGIILFFYLIRNL
jgi:hypothetical protein